jgi:trimeric autotransporter adhesin
MAFKRILLRRDTASNWTSGNPVLASGEVGYETNTGKFKIGNGSTAWTSLSYASVPIGLSVLNDLSDVTITSAANGDFLRWNGSAWVNDAVNLSTDTIGSYVESLVAGTGVTLTNNSGEGATPTVAVDTTVIAPLASPTFTGTVSGVTKTMVGLGNVDNTSDANKPVSTATQTALDLKAPLASPTFTGTVAGITATMVGLGNVNNTSDANKPISTATQTALDLKAPLASPTFTGTATTNDLTVSGNLTVSGTTTSINTETLTVNDNVVVLNNNVTGAPTEDAGIEVERGSSTNVVLRWNETTDAWELTNDGTTYSAIATAASVATATALTVDNLTDVTITSAADKDFLMYNGTAWVDQPITLGTDTTGNYMSGVSAGTGISVTHTPGEGSTATIAVDATVATLASPAFTGTPTAPTAAVGTSTTQIATTAFVMGSVDNDQFILAGQIF